MTRIGGGGPKQPGGVGHTPPASDLHTREGVQKFRDAAKTENVPSKVVDSFERAAPKLDAQLSAISGKALAGQLKFGSAELAQLAGAFALIVKQHPRADRKERARLFARAIAAHRRIGKLFEGADERELEDLFDGIAEQLDGSPVFAQLVDDVTEGARKIDLG